MMRRFHVASRVLLSTFLVLPLAACPNPPAMSEADALEVVADDAQPTASPGEDPASGLEIIEIAPGEGHTVVLTEDGSVWTCGNGGDGQLGWEQTDYCFSGVRVVGLPAISDVAAGTGYSIFLAEDGSVWGAGYGFDERLGPTESTRFTEPVELGIDDSRVVLGG